MNRKLEEARSSYVLLISVLLILIMLIMGCAVTGINPYQDAEVIGNGHIGLGAGMGLGRRLDTGIHVAGGDIWIEDDLKMNDFVYPMVGCNARFGLSNSTDIQGQLSLAFPLGSSSFLFSMKQKIVHTNRGIIISFMPGISGTYIETTTDYVLFSTRFVETEKYDGYGLTLPLILSKKWQHFSIFFTPRYMFNLLRIKNDHKTYDEEGTLETHDSAEKTFDLNSYGGSIGFSIFFKHFALTPEVAAMKVDNLPEGTMKWIFYPGLGFEIRF